jgi:hypothetical protein
MLSYGCASIGLILSALTPALADEEPVVRNDHLAFTYQIYDDGTVDAAWGAGKNIKTVERSGLVPVEILLPPDIADKLESVRQANSLDPVEGVLEILVFVGGYSVCGSRCHDLGGGEHCHTC